MHAPWIHLKTSLPFIPLLAALASCSSPPKPPTVDKAHRRPINTASAVELQACKNELQNTRIVATETGQAAESASATLANLLVRQRALASLSDPARASPADGFRTHLANGLFTIRFDYGSAKVEIAEQAAAALMQQARSAPLVLLRGRTDGATDNLAEARMARERSLAVRDLLVAGGVDPARIRATYQPTGDRVADNDGATGRALNRRVEIELYRELPVVLDVTTAAR